MVCGSGASSPTASSVGGLAVTRCFARQYHPDGVGPKRLAVALWREGDTGPRQGARADSPPRSGKRRSRLLGVCRVRRRPRNARASRRAGARGRGSFVGSTRSAWRWRTSCTSAPRRHFEPLYDLPRSKTAQTGEPPPTRGRGRSRTRTGLETVQVSTGPTGACGKRWQPHRPQAVVAPRYWGRAERTTCPIAKCGENFSSAALLGRAQVVLPTCRQVRYVPTRPGAVGRAVAAFPQSTVGTPAPGLIR